MLKYLDDTDVIAPRTAKLSKDMSETEDEYKLDDGDDRDMVAEEDGVEVLEGIETLFGDEDESPDEEEEETKKEKVSLVLGPL